MEIKTVLFDFDGVLCHDRFYEKTLIPEYQEVYDWIQTNVFYKGSDLPIKWMAGELSSSDINKLIAKNTNIEYKKLCDLYEKSVKRMELDQEMLELADSFRNSGKKNAIVTGNMDVFSEITVPNHKLDERFDLIVNSSDYKLNKDDNGGELFDIVLEKLESNIKDCLLIDDSKRTIELFRKKGGIGHEYKNYKGLIKFLGER